MGNHLFVANYLANNITGYNINTGAADFRLIGLSQPVGAAAVGNNLYSNSTNIIREFSIGVGGTNDPNFASVAGYPSSFAISGNDLFVANGGGSQVVSKIDATTGATIKASFITGLAPTGGMEVIGSVLFVAYENRVGKFDVNTGAAIDATFIPNVFGPTGMAIVPEPSGSMLMGSMVLWLYGVTRLRSKRF